VAFRNELAAGTLHAELDPNDVEQSLLRQRLLRRIPYGTIPDIRDLTEITREVILEDLRGVTKRMPGWARADVAVFSAIHIHTPRGDFVQPGWSFVRAGDEGTERTVEL
jgi:hypothetical protein